MLPSLAETLPPRTMPWLAVSVDSPFATSDTFPAAASMEAPDPVLIDPAEAILTSPALALMVPDICRTPAGSPARYPPTSLDSVVSSVVVSRTSLPVTLPFTATYSLPVMDTAPSAVIDPASSCDDLSPSSVMSPPALTEAVSK